MDVALWILGWAVVLGLVTFLAVRERRSGRTGPGDLDRTRHAAVQQATMDAQTHGPSSTLGTFGS